MQSCLYRPEQSRDPDGDSVAPPQRNPYLLVVGCPRSGTTLLQRMLDSHPLLAVANDTHFITRVLQKTSPHLCDSAILKNDVPLTTELIEGASNYHRFSRLGLPKAAVDEVAAGSRTYREFVSALYTQYGLLHDKMLSGEKTPDYVRFLPMLHALLPWVRTVHIIRDGRDVALSTLEWANENKGPGKFERWRDEPFAVCALWWRWQVNAGRHDGERLGPAAYREVGYEKLVSHAEKELRRVTDFLNLQFAPQMLTYHEGKSRPKLGRSAKSAWLPPTAGLRDWRTQMRERDIALFEAIAGQTLVDLGYERTIENFPRATRALAQSYEDWWQARTMSPNKTRPTPECDTPST